MTSLYANTFHFVDPNGKDPTICEMRIEVNEIVSNRPPELPQLPTTYQIIMNSCYRKNDNSFENVESFVDIRKYPSHPFNNLNGMLNLYVMSVVKNDMTTAMIDMMMKNDAELAVHTGNITPKKYRREILRGLTTFTE